MKLMMTTHYVMHTSSSFSPTDVALALADAGSTLSDSEGASIDVCVNITQDAPDGRECPINVTLTYDLYGDKPGKHKCSKSAYLIIIIMYIKLLSPTTKQVVINSIFCISCTPYSGLLLI